MRRERDRPRRADDSASSRGTYLPLSFLGIRAPVWWMVSMAIAFGIGIWLSTWALRLPRPIERRVAAVRSDPGLPALPPDRAESIPDARELPAVVIPPPASVPRPADPDRPASAGGAVTGSPTRAPLARPESSRDAAARPPIPAPLPTVIDAPAGTPLPPVVATPAPARDADPTGGAAPMAALPAAPRPAAPDEAPPAAALREEAAVRRTLDDYAVAYRALDVTATAQAWPTVDRQALARAFATLKSQDVTFDTCAVTVDGAQAVARCRGVVRFVRKVGGPGARLAAQQWEFRMRRVDGAWKIDDVVAASGASAP